MQKQTGLLGYPRDDFYASHPGNTLLRITSSMLMLIVMIFITASVLGTSMIGLGQLLSPPINRTRIIGIILLSSRSILGISLYVIALFWFLGELNNKSTDRKRMHRSRAYRVIAYILLPSILVQLVAAVVILNELGWQQATSTEWMFIAGSFIFIGWGCFILLMLRNPVLYFNRAFSLAYDMLFALSGLTIWLNSVIINGAYTSDPFGLLLLSFGLGMSLRTIRGKETLAQQTIASIYRLPDLVNRLIPIEQRQIALAIALGKYHHNLSRLEREELESYLVHTHKLTPVEWVKRALLALVTAFLLALLAEGPATYIFQMIVESFSSK